MHGWLLVCFCQTLNSGSNDYSRILSADPTGRDENEQDDQKGNNSAYDSYLIQAPRPFCKLGTVKVRLSRATAAGKLEEMKCRRAEPHRRDVNIVTFEDEIARMRDVV